MVRPPVQSPMVGSITNAALLFFASFLNNSCDVGLPASSSADNKKTIFLLSGNSSRSCKALLQSKLVYFRLSYQVLRGPKFYFHQISISYQKNLSHTQCHSVLQIIIVLPLLLTSDVSDLQIVYLHF